jgi:AraC family transcriptional regulator
MQSGIELLNEKKLIGKHMSMCLADNKTFELWKSFMPRRKEIKNSIGTNLFSIQVYDEQTDFNNFDLHTVFEKWAAVEVTYFDTVPTEMETYTLRSGLYAVFIHEGAAKTAAKTFQYIYGEWLPSSIYLPDNRPQFEILGEKYKNDDSESEEEVWIPIKLKK